MLALAASPPLASPRGARSRPHGSPADRRPPPASPPLAALDPRRQAAAAARSSLYEVLRVNRTASPTEIKGAYRTLAKLYHPDALGRGRVEAGSDGRDFLEIHDAYATLSDPSARALYDLSLGSHQRRRHAGGAACCPTRSWETDQCW